MFVCQMALHLFLDAFVFVQVLQCLFLLLVVFQGVFEDQSETDDGEDGQVAEGDGESCLCCSISFCFDGLFR